MGNNTWTSRHLSQQVAHLLVKLGTFHRSLEYLNLIPMTVDRLLEVLDKGKAAAVTTIIETKDVNSGKVIFENQSTVFIRGAGGFGGKRTGKGIACADEPYFDSGSFWTSKRLHIPDRGAATAPNNPPKRAPDAIVEEKTSTSQAALYRYVTHSFIFFCLREIAVL